MDPKEKFVLFVKGAFMGMADIVPGVSGGTIALITGIYERLIEAIESIKLRSPGDIDLGFLVPLGLGVAISFLLVSRVILFLVSSYEGPVYSFFFGLILASAIVVYRRTSKLDLKDLTFSVFGFVVAFLVVGLEYFQLFHSPAVLFLSGFLAICAMLLPGVSGSFVLLLLGQYEYMLGAIHNFQAQYLEIVVFLGGCFTSLFAFSRFIGWLLENHENLTFSFLVGLMLGALRLPVAKISSYGSLGVIVPGVFGLLVVLSLEELS